MTRTYRWFTRSLASISFGLLVATTVESSPKQISNSHLGAPVYQSQKESGEYWVQVYASKRKSSSPPELARLNQQDLSMVQGGDGLYRILMGPFKEYRAAQTSAQSAKAVGIDGAFIRYASMPSRKKSQANRTEFWLQAYALRSNPDIRIISGQFPGQKVRVETTTSGWHRILIGPYESKELAENYRAKNAVISDALVRQYDVTETIVRGQTEEDALPELGGSEVEPQKVFDHNRAVQVAVGVKSGNAEGLAHEMAQEATDKIAQNAVDHLQSSEHNPFKWIEFELGIPDGDRGWTFDLDTHYSLFEDDSQNIFLQTGVRRHEAGRQSFDPKNVIGDSIGDSTSELATTLNIGLGYRSFTTDKQWLLGGNVFYDYQFQSEHERLGLGLEALSDSLDFNANLYKSLSGWNESHWNADNKHRVMDGLDIGVRGRLPAVPSVEVGLTGYKFFGDDGLDDLSGYVLSAKYQPFPAISFSIDHDLPEGGSSDTQLKLEYRHLFGVPVREQFEPVSAQSASVFHRRYEKVKRDYTIKVQSDQDVVDLPGVTPFIVVGGLEFFRPQLTSESISAVQMPAHKWARFSGVTYDHFKSGAVTETLYLQSADKHCKARGLRLPTITELQTLYAQEGDLSAHGWPTPIHDSGMLYWSSTEATSPIPPQPYMFVMVPHTGSVGPSNTWAAGHHVSCVR